MDKKTKRLLEQDGWTIGSATEFAGLAPEEEKLFEMRLALADLLAQNRKKQKKTQKFLSKEMHTSQPRIAAAEAGRTDVSFDFLIKGLLILKTPPKDIGKAIAQA